MFLFKQSIVELTAIRFFASRTMRQEDIDYSNNITQVFELNPSLLNSDPGCI